MHILGLSETKLKEHKLTSMFQAEGYKTPFRKDNYSNGGGGSWYMLEMTLMLNVEKI